MKSTLCSLSKVSKILMAAHTTNNFRYFMLINIVDNFYKKEKYFQSRENEFPEKLRHFRL